MVLNGKRSDTHNGNDNKDGEQGSENEIRPIGQVFGGRCWCRWWMNSSVILETPSFWYVTPVVVVVVIVAVVFVVKPSRRIYCSYVISTRAILHSTSHCRLTRLSPAITFFSSPYRGPLCSRQFRPCVLLTLSTKYRQKNPSDYTTLTFILLHCSILSLIL